LSSYYQKNKLKINAKIRKDRLENPEKYKKYRDDFNKNHPDRKSRSLSHKIPTKIKNTKIKQNIALNKITHPTNGNVVDEDYAKYRKPTTSIPHRSKIITDKERMQKKFGMIK